MRVFVAYGFRPRDRWIRDHVIPIIEAFGAQPVTGEELGGQQISEAVKQRIQECDGLLAFLMAREPAGTPDETHRWVTDELAFAQGVPGMKTLEVRETTLTDQGGLPGDRQHLVYDPNDEARTLVDIARVIGEWSHGLTMKVLLLPEDVVRKITPLRHRPGFQCTYTLIEAGRETAERPATLIRRPGGLELTARGLPPGSLISVRVQASGSSFASPFVDADALSVELEEEE